MKMFFGSSWFSDYPLLKCLDVEVYFVVVGHVFVVLCGFVSMWLCQVRLCQVILIRSITGFTPYHDHGAIQCQC